MKMKYMILKLNIVAILLLFESFVKTDIIHKGINQNSEAIEIRENHTRKLSDDGGYIKIYYKSEANYPEGFKKDYRKNIAYIINGASNTHIGENGTFTVSARTQIEIHFNIPPNDLENFFSSAKDDQVTKIESIDLSHLDTSSVTTMYRMFYGCSSLKSIDFSNFITTLVGDMQFMFYKCALSSLNLSNFDTSSVTSMNRMFDTCSQLRSIDLSNFNTSSVTWYGSYVLSMWSIKINKFIKF